MITEQLENAGLKCQVSFRQEANKPYEVEIDRNGRKGKNTFATYEEAVRWFAPIMEMPYLTALLSDEDAESIPEKHAETFKYFRDQLLTKFTINLTASEKQIINIQGNGRIRFFDLEERIQIEERKVERLDNWAVSPDGQKAVFIRGQLMEIWDLEIKEPQQTIPLPFKPKQAFIWSDNQTLTIANEFPFNFPNDTSFPFIQLYNLTSGQFVDHIKEWPALRTNSLINVVFSPHKDWVTFGIEYEGPYADRIRLFIYPVFLDKSGQPRKPSPSLCQKIGAALRRSFSLLNFFSGRNYLVRYQGCYTYCAVFTQDGQSLFIGMENSDHRYYNEDRPVGHHIHVWKHTGKGKFVEDRWLEGHKALIRWLFVTPDDRQLISVSIDGNIRLWDVRSREEQHSFMVKIGHPTRVSFAKNGQFLALGDQHGVIIIWNVQKGELAHTLQEHQNSICSLDFIKSGNTLYSADESGTILEWSLTPPSTGPRHICEGDIMRPDGPESWK